MYKHSSQKARIKTLEEIRWWYFTHKHSRAGNMPPSRASLYPAIRRANYQAMEWKRCNVSIPNIPPPTDCDWTIENGFLTPITCDVPCGPEELICLTKRSCYLSRCAPPCICALNKLTETCSCLGYEDYCDNSLSKVVEDVTEYEDELNDDEEEVY